MCAGATAPASAEGPFFRGVDTVTAAELRASGEDVTHRCAPVLVKGAVAEWPAAARWTFSHLADVCGCAALLGAADRRGGARAGVRRARARSHVLPRPVAWGHACRVAESTFYDGGPAEQGVTLAPVLLPVAPSLRRQAAAAGSSSAPVPWQSVVLPATLPDGAPGFALNWTFAPQPREPYLAQWSILNAFPVLRRDLRPRALWRSRWRLVREHVFIGPAGTVSGLHADWNPNVFVGLRGVKDWILFPPGQDDALQPSDKFDWGATCSAVDVSRLRRMAPAARAAFAAARGGTYARVEPGDALYVPPGTWHAVVARTPCISLSVFGLTLFQVLTSGVLMTLLKALHALGLYRRGNCTCCRNTGAPASRAKAE